MYTFSYLNHKTTISGKNSIKSIIELFARPAMLAVRAKLSAVHAPESGVHCHLLPARAQARSSMRLLDRL
ncbi:hypothetical protein [Nostoc sp. ChiVER01]|uniref:hypothetical protein n=1 Tax=Nostoc sp. ChiVER01 TaxID=3075382 RepID=UPI002AD3A9CF|nr:hypothetical protein [Nostoc sp. ChiVER01]MDZ8225767.1 hypothetical protein [Nostoc sp. ChiVER01]